MSHPNLLALWDFKEIPFFSPALTIPVNMEENERTILIEGFTASIKNIQRAIDQWNDNTVIKFIPFEEYARSSPLNLFWAATHNIKFVFKNESDLRSSSPVGMQRQTNGQKITFGLNTKVSTFVHELGHSLGLFHEQQRFDRGDFVIVDRNNFPTKTEYTRNFKIKNSLLLSTLPKTVGNYDINSIMHYSRQVNEDGIVYFDKQPNIVGNIGNRERELPNGQTTWLSRTDIAIINSLYENK